MAKNPKKKIEGLISKSIEEAKADDARVNSKKADAPKSDDASTRSRPDKPLLTGSPKKPVPPPPSPKGPKQVTNTELTDEEKEIIEETLKLPKEKAPGEVQSPYDQRLAELPPHVRREIMKEEPGRNRSRDRARKAAERNTPEDKQRKGHTIGETRKGDIKRARKKKTKEERSRELSEIAKAKASKFSTEAEIADMKYDKAAAYDAELLAPGSTPYPETAPIKPKRDSYPGGDKGTSDYADALRSYEAALNQHNYGTPDLPWALQGIPEFLRTYTTGGLPGISYDPKSPYADKHGYVSSRDGKTPTEQDLIAHIIFLGGIPGVDDLDDVELMSDKGPVNKAELYQATGDIDSEGRSEVALGAVQPVNLTVTDAARQAASKAGAVKSEMVQDTQRRIAEAEFAESNEAVYGVGPTTSGQRLDQDIEVDPDLAPSRLSPDGTPSSRGTTPQATTREQREAARLGYTRRLLTRALNYRDKFRDMEKSDNTFDTFSSTEPQRSSYKAGKEGDRAYQQDLVLYNLSFGKKIQMQESMEREQRDVRIRAAKDHLTAVAENDPMVASFLKNVGHANAAESLLSPAIYERTFGKGGFKFEGEEQGLTHSEFQEAFGFDEDVRDDFIRQTSTAYPSSGRQTTEVLDPVTGQVTYDITRPGLSKAVVEDQKAKFGAEVRSRPPDEGGKSYLYRGVAPGPVDYLYSHIFDLQESLPKQPAGTVLPSQKREGDPGSKRTTGSGLTRSQLQAVNELRKQGRLGLRSNEIFSEGVQDPTLNPLLFKVDPVTKVETAKGAGGRFTKPAAERVKQRASEAGTLAPRALVYETRLSDETEDVQVPVTENDETGNPTVTGMRTEKRRKTFQSPVIEEYQETDDEGNLKFQRKQKVDDAGNPVYDENNKPVMERIPIMGKRQKTAPVGVDASGRRLGVFQRQPKTVTVGKDPETGEPLTETTLGVSQQITGYNEVAARAIQQAADRGTLSPQLRQQFGLTSSKDAESLIRTAERLEEKDATDEEYAKALGKSAESFNLRSIHIASALKDLEEARRLRRVAEERTRKDIEAGTHTKLNAAGESVPGMTPLGEAPQRSEYDMGKEGEEEYTKAVRRHNARRGQVTRAIKDSGREAVKRHIERIRNQSELEFDERTGDFVYEEVDVGGETVRRPKLKEDSAGDKGTARVDNEVRATILERLLGTPPTAEKRTIKRRVYGGKYYTTENREINGRKIFPAGLKWAGATDVSGMEVEDIGDVEYTHNPSEKEKKDWEKYNDYTRNKNLPAEIAINNILSSFPKLDESGQVVYSDDEKKLPEKMFPETPPEMESILEDMGLSDKGERIKRLSRGDFTPEDIALARAVRQRGYKATASGITPRSESQERRLQDAKEGKRDEVADALNASYREAERHQRESQARAKEKLTEPRPPVSAPSGVSGYAALPFLPQKRKKITGDDGSISYGATTGIPVTGNQFAGVDPLRRYAKNRMGEIVTENEDSPLIDPTNLAFQEEQPGTYNYPIASNELQDTQRKGRNWHISKQMKMDDSGIVKYTSIDPSIDEAVQAPTAAQVAYMHRGKEDASGNVDSSTASVGSSSGSVPSVGSRAGTGEHQLTTYDFKDIQSQLHELKTTGRQKIADQLAESAAFGDLRENAEHEANLAEQTRHESRISELEHKLNNHTIIDPFATPGVGPGKHVTLELNGVTQTYEIPTGDKSSAGKHPRLSSKSPIGAAIVGKDVGHTFEVNTPGGRVSGTVKGVEVAQKEAVAEKQPNTSTTTSVTPTVPTTYVGFEKAGVRKIFRNKDGIILYDNYAAPSVYPPHHLLGRDAQDIIKDDWERVRSTRRGGVRGSGSLVRLGNMVRGIPQKIKPQPRDTAPVPTKLDSTLESLPDSYTVSGQIRQNIGQAIDANMPVAPALGRFVVDELRSRQPGPPTVVNNQPISGSTRTNVRSGSGRFPVNPGVTSPVDDTFGFDNRRQDTPVIQSVVSGESSPPAGTSYTFLPGAKVSEIQEAIDSARSTRATPEFVKQDARSQAARNPVPVTNQSSIRPKPLTKYQMDKRLSPQFDNTPAKTDEQP